MCESNVSLRKQPAFREVATSAPAKRGLKGARKGGSFRFGGSFRGLVSRGFGGLFRGVSGARKGGSFRGYASGDLAKRRLFSQAKVK